MTRVKGPLFSVSASGDFLGLMEFRTTGDQTIVAGHKQKPSSRSPAQVAQSLRFKNAIDGWKSLGAAAQLTWKNRGIALGMTGYQLFISEYQTQNIVPPGIPILP